MSTEGPVSVVHVVDDDVSVRSAIAFLLRAAGIQFKTYESGSDLLRVADSLDPGCVIMDVRMPLISGLDVQDRLKVLRPDLPVLVMTGHGDVPMAVRAMRSGAVDFVEKPFDEERFMDTVRSALHEANIKPDGPGIPDRMATLSPRERSVLGLLMEGLPNKQIAHELGISQRTVEVHRAKVMNKIGAGNLASLIRMVLAIQTKQERPSPL